MDREVEENLKKLKELLFSSRKINIKDLLPADPSVLSTKNNNYNSIFPELSILNKTDQPEQYHSEGNVLIHTVNVFNGVREYYRTNDIADKVDSRVLFLGALLHDIGKCKTRKIDGNNKITFIGHDKEGAEMVYPILRKFGLQADVIKSVTYLVANHMRIKEAHKMKASKVHALKNHPNFNELLILSYIDSVESRGTDPNFEKTKLDWYYFLAKKQDEPHYKVIRGNLLNKMIELVNKDYKEWKPLGAPFKDSLDYYCQAVTRREKGE